MKTIVVCGYHRSGTSMTMQALTRAGLKTSDFLLGIHPTNSDGHFEAANIVRYHEEQLKLNGTDWLCEEYYYKDVTPSVYGEFKLDSESGYQVSDSCWGFKDPRASLFLDYWDTLLPNMTAVVVVRHYLSCISSLRKRSLSKKVYDPSTRDVDDLSWLNPDSCLRSWIVYNQSILEFIKSKPENSVVFEYDQILEGYPLVKILNMKCDISLDENSDTNIRTGPRNTKALLDKSEISSSLQVEANSVLQQLLSDASKNRDICNSEESRLFDHETWVSRFESKLNRLGVDIYQNFDTNTLSRKPEYELNYLSEDVDVLTARTNIHKNNMLHNTSLLEELVAEYFDADTESGHYQLLICEMAVLQKNLVILEKCWKLISARSGRSFYCHFVCGLVYEHMQDYAKAEIAFKSALAVSSDSPSLECILCVLRVMQKQGMAELAITELDSFNIKVENSVLLMCRKMELLVECKQFGEAAVCFSDSIRKWPKNPGLYFQRYKLARMLKETKKAEVALAYHKFYKIMSNKKYYFQMIEFVDLIPSEISKAVFSEKVIEDIDSLFQTIRNKSFSECI